MEKQLADLLVKLNSIIAQEREDDDYEEVFYELRSAQADLETALQLMEAGE